MKSSIRTTIAALCLISAPLWAAIPTQTDLDRAAMLAAKKAIVGRAMNLDEQNAAAFWPLYDQYQEAREAVNDKMLAMIQDYAKNYRVMTDGKALELLNTMLKLQDEKNKVRADFVSKFSKVLPGAVVARFFQADNKIEAFASANAANLIPLVPMVDLQAMSQNAPSALTSK